MSRFGTSLIVAGCLHGALLLARALSPAAHPVISVQPSPVLEIEIQRNNFGVADPSTASDATRVVSAPNAPPHGAPIGQLLNRGHTIPQANPTASANVESTAVALVEGSDVSGIASGAPTDSAPPRAAKIDFGLDGRMFREVPSDAPPLTRPDARPRRKSRAELEQALNGSLRDALKADDVAHGYAIGNALVGSLTSAVRNAGPAEGNALISVTINSAGEVSELKLLRGDPGTWSLAMQAFRRQTKQRRLLLPAGSQGLRVTYDVSSKIQLPSGKKIDAATVRVKRPSLAPNGLALRGDFDVADLSGKTSQMVTARIVHEELL